MSKFTQNCLTLRGANNNLQLAPGLATKYWTWKKLASNDKHARLELIGIIKSVLGPAQEDNEKSNSFVSKLKSLSVHRTTDGQLRCLFGAASFCQINILSTDKLTEDKL